MTDTTSPAAKYAAALAKMEVEEVKKLRLLLLDGLRYRWMRQQAMDCTRGLESFVAMAQLDHMASEARFDEAIDKGMKDDKVQSV